MTAGPSPVVCGHRSAGFACVLPAGPHSITRDGRVQHYYRPAVA